jgi:succinate dehydrogenase / fumarate reductase cytochrome b subunit
MKPQRPYFLDLVQIRLPIGAVVSILHRASGAGLSLAVPFLLYLLMLSLESPMAFHRVARWLHGGLGWLLFMAVAWALLHHLFAGLCHLGFDIGLGEAKLAARRSAWASLIGALLLTAILALWSWA